MCWARDPIRPGRRTGPRIAFERAERGACVLDLCALNIYTMAVDGTDVKKLTGSTQPLEYAAAPAWSPDGTRIAYLSGAAFTRPILRVMTSAGAIRHGRSVPSRRRQCGHRPEKPSRWPSPHRGAGRIVAISLNGGAVAELVDRTDAVPTSWR